MRIFIDTAKCTGHGVCYDLAPALITDDEYGRGAAMHELVPEGQESIARQARDNCPERAISVQD